MTLEPAPFRVIPALLFALLLPAIHPAFAEDPPPLQDQPVPDITRFPATDTPATPPLPVPKPTTPPPAKIPGQLTIPASPDMPVMAAPSSLALLPDSALPPASAKHPQPPIWADDHADSAGQTVAPGNKAAVLFPSGSAALPDDAAQKLAPLRDLLKAFPNERLRLTAYASGAPDGLAAGNCRPCAFDGSRDSEWAH